MSTDKTVLVVDDEQAIQDVLNDYLSSRGYEVLLAHDGVSMREQLSATLPKVILLDINLPGEDGLSLARYIRSQGYQIGIIMVTGQGDVVDRVLGLEMGADDYIAKPFDLRELQARINSVLRRYQTPAEHTSTNTLDNNAQHDIVPFGTCLLNIDLRQLANAEGIDIPISRLDFELLHMFVTRPNRILTRDQILEYTQNRSWDPYDRSIDIRIARLRKKVEPDYANPRIIKTVRGAGYIYIPTDST